MADPNPTVKEMVTEFLKLNGFTGLFSPDMECACILEDLMPCDEYYTDCECGYKNAKHDLGEEFDWIVQREKPDK